ncbi:MAG: hypothetical protein U0105_17160 [Candidatus Obscuribacterales bacterium]
MPPIRLRNAGCPQLKDVDPQPAAQLTEIASAGTTAPSILSDRTTRSSPKKSRQQIALVVVAATLAVILSISDFWLGTRELMSETEINATQYSPFETARLQLRVARARLLSDREAERTALGDLGNYKWHHCQLEAAVKIYEALFSVPVQEPNFDTYDHIGSEAYSRLSSYYKGTHNIKGDLRLFELRHRDANRLPTAADVAEADVAADLYERMGDTANARRWRQAGELGRSIPLYGFTAEEALSPDVFYYSADYPKEDRDAQLWLGLGIERLYTLPHDARAYFLKALQHENASESQKQRARVWLFVTAVENRDWTRCPQYLQDAKSASDWLEQNQIRHQRGVCLEGASFWAAYRQYLQNTKNTEAAEDARHHQRALETAAADPMIARINVDTSAQEGE